MTKEVILKMKDHAFSEALEEASREIGKANILQGHYSTYLSLPLPSISLRYLLQYDGFPLGCFVLIIGEKASFKTNLSCFFASLHNQQDGFTIFLDTEGGAAPIAKAILGDNLILEDCPSIENWYEKLKIYSEKLEAAVAKGRVYPVCFIIDSIAGSESEKTASKIDEEGISAVSIPTEARMISAILRHKHKVLLTNPFTIIGTNHIKKVIGNTTNPDEEYFPGGKALAYHAQIILKVKKTKKPEIVNDAYRMELQLSVEKNRFGPEKLYINVPVTIKGGDKVNVKFEWHKSTVDLLCDGLCFPIKYREKMLGRIREVVNIESRSGGAKGTLYYSSELGIPREKAVVAEEISEAIESNQQLLDDLYKVLFIKHSPKFQPCVDYMTQLKRAAGINDESEN
ncbi:MAG: hypothetical protein QW303_00175 [Nitrososphaerota archaeon]